VIKRAAEELHADLSGDATGIYWHRASFSDENPEIIPKVFAAELALRLVNGV